MRRLLSCSLPCFYAPGPAEAGPHVSARQRKEYRASGADRTEVHPYARRRLKLEVRLCELAPERVQPLVAFLSRGRRSDLLVFPRLRGRSTVAGARPSPGGP